MNNQKIFIVDDDSSARKGITRLLEAANLPCEAFKSAKDFLNSESYKEAGCLILDVSMPEMTGPELQDELQKFDYVMPIIFLSAHGDVPLTATVMKKGAVDFLTKPVDKNDLIEAIERALKSDAENRSRFFKKESIQNKIKMLTQREYMVMTFVITGMLNKQIAAQMKISEETVKIHRGRVMKKLEIASVAELVNLCNIMGISQAEH